MMVRLEHANLAVPDLAEALRFLGAAFPAFRVRASGNTWSGAGWVHCGTDTTYVALQQATGEPLEAWVPYGGKPGLNHLGFEVDDVEALRTRLAGAGYRETTVPNRHPHRKRIYFADGAGSDWEFVEYRNADPALRNDYSIPDVT